MAEIFGDTDSRRDAIAAALKQWPSNPSEAVRLLKALADAGDADATILVAYLYMQQGQYDLGIPYAEKSLDGGAPIIAANYGPNLVAAGDRVAAVKFFRAAIEGGWPIDLIGFVPQMVQAGDIGLAFELLELARRWPLPFDGKVRHIEKVSQDIDAAARATHALVEGVRQTARGADEDILAEIQSIQAQRQRADVLLGEVSDLVHNIAAGNLAAEYASHASAEERTAHRYTIGSIGLGAIAVGFAVWLAAHLFNGSSVGVDIASKAAVTLPLAAFAAYLASLASTHRRMAWHWRHVELQIRTAEPFIAALGEEQRKAVLAALALRFFPGQSLDPLGKNDERAAVDLSQVISDLLKKNSPSV